MDTVFHVGMSKAGSTALQDSLCLSHDYLRDQGVLYPRNAEELSLNNHRLLIEPLDTFNKLPRDLRRISVDQQDLRAKFLELVSSIHRQITESSPSCLILSSEHFWWKITRESVKITKKTLDEFMGSRPRVVVYIRRPSSRYLSALQQGLKHGVFIQPKRPQYTSHFNSLEAVFGKSAVVPIVFDRSLFKDGDIVTDFSERFLKNYGIDPHKLAEPKRKNESISAAALKLLDLFRIQKSHGKADDLDIVTLRRNIIQAENRLKLSRPRLRPKEADKIDFSSTEPLWLLENHGIEFANFDYRRLECGYTEAISPKETLDSLIDVDIDEFTTLIRDLGSGPIIGIPKR